MSYREEKKIDLMKKSHVKEFRTEKVDLTLKKVDEETDNQVHKILFETIDGYRIEAVRMVFRPNKEREKEHVSICISSQVGCALGCKFCGTGALGLKKNLTVDEIVSQALYFTRQELMIGNISFMGMGEPFANEDNVFKALDYFTNPELMGISSRRISVSTVGIVPGIRRLTKHHPQVNLTFSLHTPFPEQRLEIMPVTKRYPIDEVMAAIDEHVRETRRKVFIAYALFSHFNDSIGHAKSLSRLLKSRKNSHLYHVNLIIYNRTSSDARFTRPSAARVNKFRNALYRMRVKHTLRQNFGTGIAAACGQLHAGYKPTK
jgi:23S rRNA (adenine-C8)-methyltransferase